LPWKHGLSWKNRNIINEKNKYINNCKNDDIYKYEYNNICYQNCPNEIILNETGNICYDQQIIDSTINFPVITSTNINTPKTDRNIIDEKKSTNIKEQTIDSYSVINNNNYFENGLPQIYTCAEKKSTDILMTNINKPTINSFCISRTTIIYKMN